MAIKTLNITAKLLIAVSILGLAFAYFVEHVLGIKPCPLCLYQRIPYFLVVIVSLTAFMTNSKHYVRYLLLSYMLLFTIGALLALYHVGVEHGLIEDPVGCIAASSNKALTKEEIKQQIFANEVSCKEVKFKILGFSMAELNLIFSSAVAIYLARVVFFRRKFPTRL